MREKTGLQRQISEIFGDERSSIKKHPSLSRLPRPDIKTPRSPKPGAKNEDEFASAGAVRPPDSRLLEIPPQRQTHEAVPREELPASSNVQMLEQRLRSPGVKTLATKIKERAKIAAVLLLTAVLVWRLVNMVYPSFAGGVHVENGPDIQAQPVVAQLPSTVWPIPQVYPQDIRDPMEWGTQENTANADIVASTPDISKPIVRGILYSEDKPRAIIGTDIVSEGDLIRGAVIVKIGRKTVEFEMNGQRWVQEVEAPDSQE